MGSDRCQQTVIRRMPMVSLLAAGLLSGCVSLSAYQELQEKYEHVVDAKLDMDRDYAESRRQLLAVEGEHARLSGQISSLSDAVEAKIRAVVGPLSADVAKLQAERTAALRERARDETAQAEWHRAVIERVDYLAKQLDRLNDRMTRAEVVISRSAPPSVPKKERAAQVSAQPVPSVKSEPAATAPAAPVEPAAGVNAAGKNGADRKDLKNVTDEQKEVKEIAGPASVVPPSPLVLTPRAEASGLKSN